MTTFADRLPDIVALTQSNLSFLIEAVGDDRDAEGHYTHQLSEALRDLAIGQFVLDRDVSKFRKQLAESAHWRKVLIDRFSLGEHISRSYVSLGVYVSVLDALAAADFCGAVELASVIDDRHEDSWVDGANVKIVGSDAVARSLCFGLKAFLLDRRGEMQHWTLQLETAVRQERKTSAKGDALVLRAMLENSDEMIDAALLQIVADHLRESRPGGFFNGMVDQLLCVSGVAYANLARHRGLAASELPPLIPGELLVNRIG
jgi:hypothetical protein